MPVYAWVCTSFWGIYFSNNTGQTTHKGCVGFSGAESLRCQKTLKEKKMNRPEEDQGMPAAGILAKPLLWPVHSWLIGWSASGGCVRCWMKEFPHNDLLIVFWQPQHILQRTVKPELWRQHAICHEWAQSSAATCFPSALLPFSPADALGKLQVWLLANSSSSPRLLLQHSIRIMFKLLLDLMLQLH